MHSSPYGMKVYWALAYKQLPFALVYVSPVNQSEIRFTQQRVVPVLRIDQEWRLDSGPLCQWLDERYPDRPVAGISAQQRDDIIAADDWVTRNIIGLSFRAAIDNDRPFSAFRNGRKLARVMRKTSGRIPWIAQFFWANSLRKTRFVIEDASQVDRSISLGACRQSILAELESRLGKTGFIAGTEQPSYADIALFAQLVSSSTFKLEGGLNAHSSPLVREFYGRMCGYFELSKSPELVPGWRPFEMC